MNVVPKDGYNYFLCNLALFRPFLHLKECIAFRKHEFCLVFIADQCLIDRSIAGLPIDFCQEFLESLYELYCIARPSSPQDILIQPQLFSVSYALLGKHAIYQSLSPLCDSCFQMCSIFDCINTSQDKIDTSQDEK